MIFLQIKPVHIDSFKERLAAAKWEITLQDGGQGHFIGWSYMIEWQKNLEGKQAKVTLHFSENQGVQESHLELNPAAKSEISSILQQLDE